MSVTEIDPGRLVRVDPEKLDADDILEFGAALIEEHGHVTGESGDESRGWSIHGAVGEAARRATGEPGKDGVASRLLRDEAAARLRDHHYPDDPAGRSPAQVEHDLNDTAAGPSQAADRMRAAKRRGA